MSDLIPIIIAIVALLLLALGAAAIIARFYRKVLQGQALIVNTMKSEPLVTFTGAVVFPIIHRAEVMDISVKTIEIDRRGKEGLICQDNIRADINVTFFVRVNKTRDDVLKVAQSIGCVRASDHETLRELFSAKFSEALKTVGKHFEFVDLYTKREEFKDQIIRVIGTDLNGYVLDDCAIDYLEQTPVEALDKDNIMDAEGIRKITAQTTEKNIQTNELRQKERMEMGSQNLTADEAIFRFEQRRAEAEAKKAKEIAIAEAREQNEAARVASDEGKKTAVVRYKNEEEALVAAEAKARAVAVAEKNREREVAIETERVEKARQLEIISREREVELTRIAKDKDVEVQKKEIADVVRSRVAVDKTVAQEEEYIKDLRVVAQAKRDKEAITIAAEAEAQEALVKQVKAAEAAEQCARFKAKEKLAIADADLEASDKQARAKIRLAEGVTAERSAEGLASVRVKEADAVATEKLGLVDAKITLEKMQATAVGEEKQGLARVRIQEAEAEAIQKQGLAKANVVKETKLAEAVGEEQKGLAEARVREAEAVAIAKRGEAEATAVRERLAAEASGLSEKANAMKALDEAGRGHEEFRLRLEKEKIVEMQSIEMRRQIAEAQASVLAEAFKQAKINIVGGDGAFFDRFVKAATLSHTLDGAVDGSDTIKTVFREYLSGEKSLPEDIRQILTRPALSSGDVQRLSLSGLLMRLASGADDKARANIHKLLDEAKKLGIDDELIR
ncbi:MAG TPA: hypothetical protein PLJ27_20045 [Polyangiaceae bacterium]|jgi:uncharacterized membrane protein YqiK|nr:hypothetical protein [Polyangiaceae bacterium]HNZ21929.1 hypothetical protein [Polyangiaceae bacterium]HOD23380.1 hypothetical protein [Polyangiaceae bacterium]HOE49322.1 hypothetical protein [Polyangiaceae bacterium]HOH00550.1 hypothetical protein [Polyangiaceae bacterium]